MRTYATDWLAFFVAKRHRRGRSYGWGAVVYHSPDRYGLINLNGSVVAPRPNRRKSRMPTGKDVGEPGAGEPHVADISSACTLETTPEETNVDTKQKRAGR